MTTQTAPPALAEPETQTHRPFDDALKAAGDSNADLTPGQASQRLQRENVPPGWLRPAASGALHGLAANASLIAGVTGGGAGPHAIALTGLAGLAAGALTMATARYAAVSSHNDVVRAQAREHGMQVLFHPDAAEAELAEVFRSRGFGAELADSVARQVSADPERALAVRLREDYGADHRHLPSPVTAAVAALASFAAGALIPLLPYLLGYASLTAALALAAVAACTGAVLLARLTSRPVLRNLLRLMLPGAAAVGILYLIGHLAATV